MEDIQALTLHLNPFTIVTHPTMSLSEEVNEEIEVLNSIYGDGTLLPSTSQDDRGVYVLVLPSIEGEADNPPETPNSTSVRISFPPGYPSTEPPSVIATHSAGASAKPGAAARTLTLFREAVGASFAPGAVCLFDAMEDFRTRLENAAAEEEAVAAAAAAEAAAEAAEASRSPSPEERAEDAEPAAWTLSDPYTEMKSTFLARAAVVRTPAQASGYVAQLLATDKRARAATHNITAWRVRGAGAASYQDCDDDGETAAGGRVLKLLQMMDVWDVMVVVTRWYGGQKLGPRRFAVINTVAREAVVRLVGEGAAGGKKKK